MPALYRAAHLKDPLERALLSRPPFRQASVNVFTCSVLVRVDPGTDAEATRQQIERLILRLASELERSPAARARAAWQRRPANPGVGARVAGRTARQAVLDIVRRLYLAQRLDPVQRSAKSEAECPRPARRSRRGQGDAAKQRVRGEAVDPCWHTRDLAALVEQLGVDVTSGLSQEQIAAQRRRFGLNRLPEANARSAFEVLVDQLLNVPVAMLAGSALLSAATGGTADAAAILLVVAVNACIGYATERAADRTIRALTRRSTPEAALIRDAKARTWPAEELVPGDVLTLAPGNYVAADARLLSITQLTVDESALTGESLPVLKNSRALREDALPLCERSNMVFRGTMVTGGTGTAVVVATGSRTEIGKVQEMVGTVRAPDTPMHRQLARLGTQTVVGSAIVCGAVGVIGLLRGQGFAQMLKTAVSLAVAAVPEGLPTVAITTLALGLRRMQERNVVVRGLGAVETLGALQVVCLDKTGTITHNQMSVTAVCAGKHEFDLTRGRFQLGDWEVSPSDYPDLQWTLRVAALCNEAQLERVDGVLLLNGSPTESALIQMALDASLDVGKLRESYPLVHTEPRAEGRGMMLTVHRRLGEQGMVVAVKGRPTEVLARCRTRYEGGRISELSDGMRRELVTRNEQLAGRALRMLGLACAHLPGADIEREHNGVRSYHLDAVELTWVGLVGMHDPPREGVGELIAQLREAGVETAMITGDQSATAYAIGKQIGLSRNGKLEILDSTQLDALPPELLRALAQRIDIFSRVSPSHKLQVVQALQSAGRVVAMSGDGINDGPALKAADIGIAMGAAGSELACEVADVVLPDDNLDSVLAAIEHGRTIYDDIRKAVRFILATNLSEILVTFATVAAGRAEAISPMQLLWINMVTDIFPELALAMEPPDKDVLGRPPRASDAPMFSTREMWRMGQEGVTISVAALAAYAYGLYRHGSGPQAGTLAFMGLTSAQLLHTLSARSSKHRLWDKPALPPNPYVPLAVTGGLGLTALTQLVPALRSALGTSRLRGLDWLVVVAVSLVPLLLNELGKPGPRRAEPSASAASSDHD
ncbi:MAG: cation-transporting P-type ATPase [Proteobacteria bacterium]|nr:cation-transporting P-type ATPase [Pseudomonadota bacterium]